MRMRMNVWSRKAPSFPQFTGMRNIETTMKDSIRGIHVSHDISLLRHLTSEKSCKFHTNTKWSLFQ